MKRSASDAGLPPFPPQIQISAIPVFNPPAGQLVPPPPPARPTMATVRRPDTTVWPQLNPAFFTFSANQAYPPGPPGLPRSLPVLHRMPLADPTPTHNFTRTAPSGSSGRYRHDQVAGKTELAIKLSTQADRMELADTLSRDNTVSKIFLTTASTEELKGIFEAICTSISILELEVRYEAPMPAPKILNELFSGLKQHQAPLKSFRWASTVEHQQAMVIDQDIFESLFALQLLEKVHFSGHPGPHLMRVTLRNADRLTDLVEKHRSLKSLSLDRIDAPAFINAILQGVAKSQIIEKIYLHRSKLKQFSTTRPVAMASNTKLHSVSIRRCELESGVMRPMLAWLKQNPALELLDLNESKIPDLELSVIGESIAELLISSTQIKTLRFKCTLSPANMEAMTIGLLTNTSLNSLVLAVEDDTTAAHDLTGANAHGDIGALFRSNKGLREIVIRLPSPHHGTGYPRLEGIAENPSIESLTIENIFDINAVIDLMKNNPGIKHLALKMQRMGFQNIDFLVDGMYQLADSLSNNKDLLSFRIDLHPGDPCGGYFSNSTTARESILRLNHLTTRNRIRNMSTLAGTVMSRRQELMPNMPGAVPPLPEEINRMIFEATINYLPPKEAKKIYDTVLPFTPLPGNQ